MTPAPQGKYFHSFVLAFLLAFSAFSHSGQVLSLFCLLFITGENAKRTVSPVLFPLNRLSCQRIMMFTVQGPSSSVTLFFMAATVSLISP